MMVWASFIAPFASGGQTVGDTDADKQLQQVMGATTVNGAVKFLRGPVLTVLRRPPFAARTVVRFGGGGGYGLVRRERHR